MHLYLMRHGRAKSASDDRARPLSDEGLRQVDQMVACLKKQSAFHVTEIRHSTLLRARQSAERLAKGLNLDVPILTVSGLEPEADFIKMAKVISEETASVLLVGHLPFMNRLASQLVAQRAGLERFNFKEATVLCLKPEERRGSGDASCWNVEWMLDPEIL